MIRFISIHCTNSWSSAGTIAFDLWHKYNERRCSVQRKYMHISLHTKHTVGLDYTKQERAQYTSHSALCLMPTRTVAVKF